MGIEKKCMKHSAGARCGRCCNILQTVVVVVIQNVMCSLLFFFMILSVLLAWRIIKVIYVLYLHIQNICTTISFLSQDKHSSSYWESSFKIHGTFLKTRVEGLLSFIEWRPGILKSFNIWDGLVKLTHYPKCQ